MRFAKLIIKIPSLTSGIDFVKNTLNIISIQFLLGHIQGKELWILFIHFYLNNFSFK